MNFLDINPKYPGFDSALNLDFAYFRYNDNCIQLSASHQGFAIKNSAVGQKGTFNFQSYISTDFYAPHDDYLITNTIAVPNYVTSFTFKEPKQLIGLLGLQITVVEFNDKDITNTKAVGTVTQHTNMEALKDTGNGAEIRFPLKNDTTFIRIMCPYQPGNQIMAYFCSDSIPYQPNVVDQNTMFDDQPNLLTHADDWEGWVMGGGSAVITPDLFYTGGMGRESLRLSKQWDSAYHANPINPLNHHMYVGSIYVNNYRGESPDYSGSNGTIGFFITHTGTTNNWFPIMSLEENISGTPNRGWGTKVVNYDNNNEQANDTSGRVTVMTSSTQFGAGSIYLSMPMIQQGDIPTKWKV